MKKCDYCHGNFEEESLNMDEGFKTICDYCLDEFHSGLRKEADCPECLKELYNGKCLTKGCSNRYVEPDYMSKRLDAERWAGTR